MSLVKLLTEYPQYSARRVRRLAVQIALLETFASKEVKGIVEDLMEFNLLQAKLESQLNDDVKIEGALQRGTELHERLEKQFRGTLRQYIDPMPVVPAALAYEIVRAMEDIRGIQDDDGAAHLAEAATLRERIHSESFTTDRKVITDEAPPIVLSTHSG